jgi:ABC-2 type transport system ATP-binding protein
MLMSMAVIEINGLCKEYRRRRGGRTRAVDGMELSVPAGGVYGFLGPNGCGKTTTIRCLLGLARPTAGECRLLGASAPGGLPDVIGRVGALVETPGLNPGLSGRQTLEILACAARLPRRTVDDALEQVGLAGRADDLVKGYSLGMRQRLGLATALLKDPEVLVLDEPANGLDPAGMREIRELIRRLGQEGRTVFLSSHLLAEVEQVCDRVAIVARGHTVKSGAIAEVLAAARPTAVSVKVRNLRDGARTLKAAGFGVTLSDRHLEVAVEPARAERVTRALVADGHYPSELRPVETSLEDAFFALTGEATGDAS